MQVQEFRAGEKIVQRGSAGCSIFFIDVGCVRAEVRGHALPDVLTSGNHFGEISFVASCKGLVPVHAHMHHIHIHIHIRMHMVVCARARARV